MTYEQEDDGSLTVESSTIHDVDGAITVSELMRLPHEEACATPYTHFADNVVVVSDPKLNSNQPFLTRRMKCITPEAGNIIAAAREGGTTLNYNDLGGINITVTQPRGITIGEDGIPGEPTFSGLKIQVGYAENEQERIFSREAELPTIELSTEDMETGIANGIQFLLECTEPDQTVFHTANALLNRKDTPLSVMEADSLEALQYFILEAGSRFSDQFIQAHDQAAATDRRRPLLAELPANVRKALVQSTILPVFIEGLQTGIFRGSGSMYTGRGEGEVSVFDIAFNIAGEETADFINRTLGYQRRAELYAREFSEGLKDADGSEYSLEALTLHAYTTAFPHLHMERELRWPDPLNPILGLGIIGALRETEFGGTVAGLNLAYRNTLRDLALLQNHVMTVVAGGKMMPSVPLEIVQEIPYPFSEQNLIGLQYYLNGRSLPSGFFENYQRLRSRLLYGEDFVERFEPNEE